MIESGGIKIKENYSLKYYVIIFIVIFISDDSYNFGTNENFIYLAIKYIVYLFLTIYLLTNTNLKFLTILTKSSLVFYSVVFSILMTAFFNLELSGGYIYEIWLFLLGFLIVNFYSHQQLIDIYLKVMFTLSVISLFVFTFANISSSFFEIFPVQINSAGATVYNLWVCMVSFENVYVRNMSIFREPGVFMIYLNIAVVFELFFKEKLNKRYLFVFIAAIFTTVSTAAFIALITIFMAYLFTKNKTKSVVSNKGYIILIMFIGILLLLLSGELYSMIFDKVGKDNISDGSSLARGISVVANINIFLDHFIFGGGIKNYPLLFEKSTRDLIGISMDVGNNTNTITTVLAVYGILFGSFFIYMIISFVKKVSNLIIVRFFIFLSMIMFYSNEDLRYSLMSACLLMWGLKSRPVLNDVRKKTVMYDNI